MTLKRLATFSIVFLTLTAIPLTTKRTEAQAPSIISGKFYKFDVIAASNEAPLASILAAPSINDNGVVSFIGTSSGGGNNVFISQALGTYTGLSSGGINNALAGNCQINNSKQVAVLENVGAQQQLRIWDGNARRHWPISSRQLPSSRFQSLVNLKKTNEGFEEALSLRRRECL